jgi:hypothetical protein
MKGQKRSTKNFLQTLGLETDREALIETGNQAPLAVLNRCGKPSRD